MTIDNNKAGKNLYKILLLLLIISLSVPAFPAGTRSLKNKKNNISNRIIQTFKTGEVLVKFKPAVSFNERKNRINNFKALKIKEISKGRIVHLKLADDKDVLSAIKELSADSTVEYAQPNYIYHKCSRTPNDPDYSQQWSLQNTGQTITGGTYTSSNPGVAGADMNLPLAWDHITDASSVTVAVVDSGINYNHEDLSANMWDGGASYPNHGYDFVDSDIDPMDLNGHGTHVAGIIGASGNNGLGNTGVCWKVKLMAVRVMDSTGSGTTANISSGIDFAVQNGAKVINLSLGGNTYDAAMSAAITNAQNHGVLVVVSAGNNGDNIDSGSNPTYPVSHTNENIVGVAALDQSYNRTWFSNYGSTSVDVGAPGSNIKSLFNGNWSVVSEDFNSSGTCDWTRSQYSAAGRWEYQQINGHTYLTNPYNFDYYTTRVNRYVSFMDSKVYKNFGSYLAGSNAAYFEFFAMIDIERYFDYVFINCISADSDPFPGGTNLLIFTGADASYLSFDISKYATTADLTFGFYMLSNWSNNSWGVSITDFNINLLSLNTNTYKVLDGTSMAAPNVAGIAALLFAYNPEFTYLDVKNSILNSGVSRVSLSGKTTSGRAVDAWRALYYINKTEGLTAVKI